MEFATFLLIITAFLVGAFVGVLLGRRSAKANRFVDEAQARADAIRGKFD